MSIKIVSSKPNLEHGSVVYSLDGRKCTTLRDFYKEIATTMNFPDYFGHNPDALVDVLENYSDYAKKKGDVVIPISHAQSFLEDEIYRYRMVDDILLAFKNAPGYWSSEDPDESKSNHLDVFFIVDETSDVTTFFKTRLQQMIDKPTS